jgi:hypothetical protein
MAEEFGGLRNDVQLTIHLKIVAEPCHIFRSSIQMLNPRVHGNPIRWRSPMPFQITIVDRQEPVALEWKE